MSRDSLARERHSRSATSVEGPESRATNPVRRLFSYQSAAQLGVV